MDAIGRQLDPPLLELGQVVDSLNAQLARLHAALIGHLERYPQSLTLCSEIYDWQSFSSGCHTHESQARLRRPISVGTLATSSNVVGRVGALLQIDPPQEGRPCTSMMQASFQTRANLITRAVSQSLSVRARACLASDRLLTA